MDTLYDFEDMFGPMSDGLVPVRVDVTVDGQRLVESVLWGIEEGLMTPEQFAARLCTDMGMPNTFVEPVATAVRDQVKGFVPPVFVVPGGQMESVQVIQLDLRVGRVVLRDQFEWDVLNPCGSPEAFAAGLVADLGLSTDFVPHVANSIREQVLEKNERVHAESWGDIAALATAGTVLRGRARGIGVASEDSFAVDGTGPSLVASDSTDAIGRPAEDNLLGRSPHENVIRSIHQLEAWQPRVEKLTHEDLERIERREIREARLARRNKGKGSIGPGPAVAVAASSGNLLDLGSSLPGKRRKRRATIALAQSTASLTTPASPDMNDLEPTATRRRSVAGAGTIQLEPRPSEPELSSTLDPSQA